MRLNPRRNNKSKKMKIVFLIIASAILGCCWLFYRHKSATPKSKKADGPTDSHSSAGPSDSTISLLATGDFIAHDTINANAKKPDGSYDYLPMMSDFLPLFKRYDIRFCNDPILNGGQAFGISGYPKFNSPTDFVISMNKLGCNLVNTASNHSFDKTQAVIDSSVDAWAQQPNMLAVVGQNKNQQAHDAVSTFTVKGVKCAFLAYTTYMNASAQAQNSYGANVFSRDFAAKQIAQAKNQGAEIIIVSMRWGTEYSSEVNASQKSDAQFLADNGATVILGHGPHVLQPAAWIPAKDGKKTLVWYSLGNFLNSQETPESLFNIVAGMEIDTTQKSIVAAKYTPIYMNYEWSAADKAAGNLLARKNAKLHFLEDANADMIDKQQLSTTVKEQEDRLQNTLNKMDASIKRASKNQL